MSETNRPTDISWRYLVRLIYSIQTDMQLTGTRPYAAQTHHHHQRRHSSFEHLCQKELPSSNKRCRYVCASALLSFLHLLPSLPGISTPAAPAPALSHAAVRDYDSFPQSHSILSACRLSVHRAIVCLPPLERQNNDGDTGGL